MIDISPDEAQQTDSEVNSVLSAYKSEGDPVLYEKAYSELKKFVEGSLDIYKVDYLNFKMHNKLYKLIEIIYLFLLNDSMN